jgi:predicted nucleic acid-binding protein
LSTFEGCQAVLDTNVVLDCFVFENAGCRPLLQALDQGLVHAVATARMRSELEHVLGRGLGERWPANATAVLARWDRHVRLLPDPPPCRLVCTDSDDQPFIDLAVAQRIPWLLTRDRALLKLARRARAFGVAVVSPERWQEERKRAAEAAL